MSNWVKVTKDEFEVGIEIATLKKGELQIKYAKDIVAKDKEIERLNNIIKELEKKIISICETCYENRETARIEKWINELKGDSSNEC